MKLILFVLVNITVVLAGRRNQRLKNERKLGIGVNNLLDFANVNLFDIENFISPPNMSDVNRIPERIQKDGYPAETHEVVTKDGYILRLHRIPKRGINKLPPVFLMHGILDSSSTWILMGPSNGLAYILSDLGYDVWMGNARGNHYSRRHKTLKPDGNKLNRKRFWEFSWNEIGMFDLPAMIDYVLEHTKSKKLHYIGHSQGTTSFFVMASEKPEYNKKIVLMQALAPIVFVKNLKSPLCRLIATILDRKQQLVDLIGYYEFLAGDDLVSSVAGEICHKQAKFTNMCENVLFLMGGYNSELFQEEKLPLMMKYTPSGASTRQVIHYGQLMNNNYFRKFDYGLMKNLRIYRSKSPPEYKLERVSTPIALHYGLNDLLAAVVDVQTLASRLPNVVKFHQVPHPKFTHMDFVWARNVSSILYDDVIDLMANAEKGSFAARKINKENALK